MQISVYERDEHVVVGLNNYVDYEPGIFFEYSISPYLHEIRVAKVSLTSLLIRLCAVIGGTLTV